MPLFFICFVYLRRLRVDVDTPEIKELKELTGMWGPHVSDWAHGGLSPPSHWIGRPVDRATRHDLALMWTPRVCHACTKAEVAADVDDGEAGGARVPTVSQSSGSVGLVHREPSH